MKIVFTTSGQDWEAKLEERFGRASGFLVYDEEGNTLNWKSNEENKDAAHGAGIQAAQKVVQTGAEAIVTGNLGPKASSTIKSANIKAYAGQKDKTIQENYDLLKAGQLTEI
jgi:predicted Fe-Mo cluster-binding NifX family protein